MLSISRIVCLVVTMSLLTSVSGWALEHPVRVAALAELVALQEDSSDSTETDRFGIEQPNGFARAELAFWQTLHGVLLGAEVCALFECDDIRLGIGSMLAGGSAGLGLSLINTPNDITTGHAHLINSATMWGLWNAFALNFILQNWSDNKLPLALMIGGQLGGLGAGIYSWDTLRPTAGDVAMVNSAGFWSGLLSVFATGALELDLNEQEMFGMLLATTNLGGAAGAGLALIAPSGAGRVFIVNASGVVGLLAGLGVAVMIQGEDAQDNVMFGASFLGTIAGLATGWFFTSDWQLLPDQQAAMAASFDPLDLLTVRFAF